jgi:hypothetical protein
MARVQLMVLVPPMVAALPTVGTLQTVGALQTRHTVPMALEVVWVCTSALLVTDDPPPPKRRRVDGHDDELIDVMAPLFHR